MGLLTEPWTSYVGTTIFICHIIIAVPITNMVIEIGGLWRLKLREMGVGGILQFSTLEMTTYLSFRMQPDRR